MCRQTSICIKCYHFCNTVQLTLKSIARHLIENIMVTHEYLNLFTSLLFVISIQMNCKIQRIHKSSYTLDIIFDQPHSENTVFIQWIQGY